MSEKCAWKRCTTLIEVDHSHDFGMFIHVGFCDFHQKVYSIQCKLFGKLDKNKHHSDISNYLWENDKKKYREIQKQAIKEAKA